jgi:probable DNA repair protein
VLGALEAAHLQFDALWIAQLTDDLWPPAPDPNPLLPYAAQRAAGIPGASAESALEHAQKLLDLWCRSADEVLVSHPLADGERELVASGLIAALPAVTLAELDVSVAPPLAQRARSGAAPETLLDPHGARVDTAAQVAGGTRIVADQSACAFRAFAVHRLGARELAEPSAALTPAERGGLLHATLAAVWRALRTQAALAATDEAALQPQVEGAADEALARVARQRPDALGPRLQALERRRLTRTVLAWLALERERPPFEVIAIEEAGVAELAGLRIDVRPDRVDRLADGTVLIIDYKTGAVSTRAWLGERPDEPQLPLYAISSGAPVSALAFAQVRSGALEWKALAAPGAGLPQATVVADDAVTMQRPGWRGLMVDWRAELERLAAAFVRGDAQVAPKGPGTCRYCALPALCRLSEREPEAARIEAGAEPGAGPGGTPERNGD